MTYSLLSTNSTKETSETQRLERIQDDAFDSLLSKLLKYLRDENLEESLKLYKVTLEQWKKEEELKHENISANEKKLKATVEMASQKMTSLFNRAKASLKTNEDSSMKSSGKSQPNPLKQNEEIGSVIYNKNSNLVDLTLKQNSQILSSSEVRMNIPIFKERLDPFHSFSLAGQKKSFFFNSIEGKDSNYENVTTPIHELSRIAGYNCIEIFDWDRLNVNEKNGKLRTLLHMVAGGVTGFESKCLKNRDIGITLDEGEELSSSTTQRLKHSLFSLYQTYTSKKNVAITVTEEEPTEHDFEKYKLILHDRENFSLFLINRDISINSVDYRNRTALHYAAELGRSRICNDLIMQKNILLTIVDTDGKTAAEIAAEAGHKELAALLEAFSVWKEDSDSALILEIEQEHQNDHSLTHPFCWFETLSLETVDAIRIERIKVIHDWLLKNYNDYKGDEKKPPAITHSQVAVKNTINCGFSENQISLLLHHFKWNTKKTTEKLQGNLQQTLTEVGITPSSMSEETSASTAGEVTCLICCDEFHSCDENWVILSCQHGFCRTCLVEYLDSCYQDRLNGVFGIPCPHHHCQNLLRVEEIKDILKSETQLFKNLSRIDVELMISSASDLRFCPNPGCEGIVRKKIPAVLEENFGENCIDFADASCCYRCENVSNTEDTNKSSITYEGIIDPAFTNVECQRQPYKAHRFCFACGEKPHWPLSCTLHQKWIEQVKVEVGEEDKKFEDLADDLWIKANTQPCPKCGVPIEKNEGCNHIICVNRFCRHEFCWICRKDWKLHSSSTGGYFRCNRWQEEDDHEFYDKKSSKNLQEAQEVSDENISSLRRPDQTYGTSVHSAKIARKKAKAMARFLHHYSRWTAQSGSAALERKMADSVLERFQPVIDVAMRNESLNGKGKDISFLYAAFTELIECRSMIKNCNVFMYFRYPSSKNHSSSFLSSSSSKLETEKISFEGLLSELEMLTEQMSDVVARAHIRATQGQIIFLTKATADKRKQLSNFVISVHHSIAEEKKSKRSRRNKKRNEEEDESEEEGQDEFWQLASRISNYGQGNEDDYQFLIGQYDAMLLDINDVDRSDDYLENRRPSMGSDRIRARHLRRRMYRLQQSADGMDRISRGIERGNNGEGEAGSEEEEDTYDDFLRAFSRVAANGQNGERRNDSDVELSTNDLLTIEDDTRSQDEVNDEDEQEDLRRAIEESIRMQIDLHEEIDSSASESDNGSNWECNSCTFINNSGRRCAMCGARR